MVKPVPPPPPLVQWREVNIYSRCVFVGNSYNACVRRPTYSWKCDCWVAFVTQMVIHGMYSSRTQRDMPCSHEINALLVTWYNHPQVSLFMQCPYCVNVDQANEDIGIMTWNANVSCHFFYANKMIQLWEWLLACRYDWITSKCTLLDVN